MISTMHIKNIGIIDDISINLESGFNVLTGETGAGKTLIIDALGMICGNRISKEMIRKGENHCYVECAIYLPENENAMDGNIIVSRELYTNGRNTCKINGRLVTVNELKEFMKQVIDIHGQNENQTLLDSSSHIDYIDCFIGKEIQNIKKEYQILYQRNQEIKKQLQENYGDEKEKQRKLDLLQYQLKEIQVANLKMGEEEKLEEQRKIILNAEKIEENLRIADEVLSEKAIDSVNIAIKALEKIEQIEEQYKEKLSELKNVYYEIQEIARDIGELKTDTYFEEQDREEIERRLDFIFSLKRKYGNSIEEILQYEQEIQKEIHQIENLEELNQDKIKEQVEIQKQMNQLAKQMNELRKIAAEKLKQNINKELQQLEMEHATCNMVIREKEEFNKNGFDEIEFLISTNIGEEEKPLIKIASGGEISRIMLAIKSVLSEADHAKVLIFDEIDIGISGHAAKAVGDKMKKIAEYHQILCVTHLATIAAKGEYHYYINKQIENGKTRTKIQRLTEEKRIEEIARIASGEINEITKQHARQLRKVG